MPNKTTKKPVEMSTDQLVARKKNQLTKKYRIDLRSNDLVANGKMLAKLEKRKKYLEKQPGELQNQEEKFKKNTKTDANDYLFYGIPLSMLAGVVTSILVSFSIVTLGTILPPVIILVVGVFVGYFVEKYRINSNKEKLKEICNKRYDLSAEITAIKQHIDAINSQNKQIGEDRVQAELARSREAVAKLDEAKAEIAAKNTQIDRLTAEVARVSLLAQQQEARAKAAEEELATVKLEVPLIDLEDSAHADADVRVEPANKDIMQKEEEGDLINLATTDESPNVRAAAGIMRLFDAPRTIADLDSLTPTHGSTPGNI